MAKRKMVIDCDAGVDDAQAILMALADHSVDVLAITCVSGNVSVENVVQNVIKVLELCDRTDIPVFKGASVPILGELMDRASYSHGKDGLGDVAEIKQPNMSLLKDDHSSDALIQLTKEHPGEITLVAIGPLTNVALACRLDAGFSSKLKNIVIMGGNIEGKGNVSVSGEFNFHHDPEAVHIVVNELTCPKQVVTWEVCLNHGFDWDFYEKYTNVGTKRSEFVKKITEKPAQFYRAKYLGMRDKYVICDPLAMTVALKPDVVLQKENVYATTELHGKLTRGQMVVDWRGVLKKEHNMTLIIQMNMDEVKQLFMNCLSKQN